MADLQNQKMFVPEATYAKAKPEGPTTANIRYSEGPGPRPLDDEPKPEGEREALLTREEYGLVLGEDADTLRGAKTLLAHDAAQRAEIERLAKERDEWKQAVACISVRLMAPSWINEDVAHAKAIVKHMAGRSPQNAISDGLRDTHDAAQRDEIERLKEQLAAANERVVFIQNLATGCDETRVAQHKEAFAERDAERAARVRAEAGLAAMEGKPTPAEWHAMCDRAEKAEMRLKNYEPVNTYNGLTIDEWKARADAAEAEVARLTKERDEARALIRRMAVELAYANCGGEVARESGEGEQLVRDAETFIEQPMKHWPEVADGLPWEKRYVCLHESRLAACLDALREIVDLASRVCGRNCVYADIAAAALKKADAP